MASDFRRSRGVIITPEGLVLFGLWLAATAYNLFKPYHIDDAAHLEIVQWISHHWLHPMRGSLNWSGVEEPIFRTNQPHLYFYALAAWGSLFGFSEPAMHALQSLFTLACILLTYRLARHLLGRNALFATAMATLSPALFVEQNLMVDVPLLSLWLGFFTPLICDVDSPHQGRRYALAALACAAAILVKYSSLTLVPILVLSLLLERRGRQAWTLAIPALAVAAWTAFNLWDYGAAHILTRPAAGGSHDWLQPAAFAGAWIVGLGALTPLGLIWMVQNIARGRAGPAYAALFAGFIALVGVAAMGLLADAVVTRVLVLLFAWNAAVMLVAIGAFALTTLRQPWWRLSVAMDAAPSLYLLFWIGGTSLFYVLFAPFIAARHVLLIIAPVTIVVLQGIGGGPSRSSKLFGLGLTILVSLGAGVSDWRFADFYKVEASRLPALVPHDGHKLWADGHWGWQWYAARAGVRELDIRKTPFNVGDLIALGDEADHQPIARHLNLTPVRTDTETLPLLNLFCTGLPDTLYLNTLQEPPWTLARHCVNHMEILRVDPDDED